MEDSVQRIRRAQRLAGEVLELCRGALLVRLRFLDRALSRLIHVPGEVGLAVDGRYLRFDSRTVLRRYREEPEQCVRDYLHVVLHCVFRHMFIHSLVDRPRWDLACDVAVEHAISSLGLEAVSAAREGAQRSLIRRLEAELPTLTAERIYRYLLDRELTEEELAELRAPFLADEHTLWYLSPGEPAPEGEGVSGPGNRAGEESDPAEEEPGSAEGERQSGGIQELEGAAGEAAPGPPREKDDAPGENSIPDAAAAPLSRREEEAFWQEVSERMQRDVELFLFRAGDAPGALVQNLREINRERRDYSAFLRQFAVPGEVMRLDDEQFDQIYYTYGLRLYENMPLVEPLEYREDRRIREFVIAIDTSASVSGALVQRFVEKTYELLLSTESFFSQIVLYILQCDAAVQESRRIASREEFTEYLQTMELRGFGGTDFRPAFRYVEKLRREGELRRLSGLIYFTDGDGVYPEKMPPYKTAFVFLDDQYRDVDVPPWAIKLILRREDI